MINRFSKLFLISTLLAGAPLPLLADTAESEIKYLLGAIAASGCTFVRNGKEHSSEDASDHLAMKYRRGRKYASTAELFIERLATKSSWTGKPYQVICPDQQPMKSGDWLTTRLKEYRNNS
ncbi:MAG: DUF5329 domain-containing protein [Gammaproteobacteria bacterium]